MKHFVTAVLVTASMATATAQEGKRERKERPNFTPEQIAELRTKKMTLHLDLTKSQQDKIYQFNLQNAQERKAKHAERKALKEKGKKLTDAEKFQRKSERLDAMIAKKAELKRILTDEQLEKFEKMVKHRKGKMKRGTKKRRGMRKHKGGDFDQKG